MAVVDAGAGDVHGQRGDDAVAGRADEGVVARAGAGQGQPANAEPVGAGAADGVGADIAGVRRGAAAKAYVVPAHPVGGAEQPAQHVGLAVVDAGAGDRNWQRQYI